MNERVILEKVFAKKLTDFIEESNKTSVTDASKSIKNYSTFLASLIYGLVDGYYTDSEVYELYSKLNNFKEVILVWKIDVQYEKGQVVYNSNNFWESSVGNNTQTPDSTSSGWIPLLTLGEGIITDSLDNYVQKTRRVLTSEGLIGGGDLSQDKYLSLDFVFLDDRYLGSGGAVTSFNGRSGDIVPIDSDYTTSIVQEGTNLYYTDARVKAYGDTQWASISRTITASGNGIVGGGSLASNRTLSLDFIYLDSRYSSSGSGVTSFNGRTGAVTSGGSDYTTTQVAEGTNLYYTNGRVDTRVNSQKGVALGLAPLDSGGKIDTNYLPDSVLGNLKYGGTYNGTAISASTDFPELDGLSLPTTGYVGVYFITTVAYTRSSVDYAIGDWAIHSGSNNYSKVDNSDSVTTVFGRLGNILAVESDYSSYYPILTGSYSNPSWITSLAWSKITGVPSFAPDSGSSNYIQNQFVSAQTASSWIDGNSIVEGLIKSNTRVLVGNYGGDNTRIDAGSIAVVPASGIGVSISAGQVSTKTILLTPNGLNSSLIKGDLLDNLSYTQYTLQIPKASGTIALVSDIPSSSNYIQNQVAIEQTANFSIKGGQSIIKAVSNDVPLLISDSTGTTAFRFDTVYGFFADLGNIGTAYAVFANGDIQTLANLIVGGVATFSDDVLIEGSIVLTNYSSFGGTIDTDTLTVDRTYILPDKSGTFAMLDDISSSISLSAIGSTPNANGASLSSGVLSLQPASDTYGGVVTTGLQTFAGNKTFNGNTTFAGSVTGTSSIFNSIKLITGASNGYVLRSDASGNASWTSETSNYWTTNSVQTGLTGNKTTSGIITAYSFTSTDKIYVFSPSGAAGAINTNQDGIYAYRNGDITRFVRFNAAGSFNDFLSAGAKLAINYGAGQVAQNVTFFEGSAAHAGIVGIGLNCGTNARLIVCGKTDNNTEYSFRAKNASGTDLFSVRNDGFISITNTLALTVGAQTTAGFYNGIISGATGSSFFTKTESVNSSYSSGLSIDGAYSGGLSSINIRAIGSYVVGGYASALNFYLTNNATQRLHASFSNNGDTSFNGNVISSAYYYTNSGIYSSTNGTYLIPNTSGWLLRSNDSNPRLGLVTSDGTLRGYISANSTGVIVGFQNTSATYVYYCDSSGNTTQSGNAYGLAFIPSSDERIKYNIQKIDYVGDALRNIDAVSYKLKVNEESHIGMIAQQVQRYFPDLTPDTGDGILGINYGAFTSVLLKGWQEHDTVINMQNTILSKHEIEIKALKERIKQLEDS